MSGPGDEPFVKQRADAPEGFFAVEAAGLRWLAAAMPAGGAHVVVPLDAVPPDARKIVLPRVATTAPSPGAARAFGRALALTHSAGAPWHGCPPPDWEGDGFIGPIPLPHNRSRPDLPWGAWFAEARIASFARTAHARGALSGHELDTIVAVCDRLRQGDETLCGPTEPVARLHGDLWSGNVLWSPRGVVLIDPAAHGGHRESDLAMLDLFGLPLLDDVLAGYHEQAPLAEGWRERVGVHQLFPLLAHAVIFGGGYGARAAAIAARYR